MSNHKGNKEHPRPSTHNDFLQRFRQASFRDVFHETPFYFLK